MTSPKEVEQKGKEATAVHKYRASKVLAERAAWKFLEDNKGSVAFDLVTICPPMVRSNSSLPLRITCHDGLGYPLQVWGPIIHDVKSVDALNTSVAGFHAHTQPGKTEKDLLAPSGSWVDVRDVALVHVLSLSNKEAGGERFIASSGQYDVTGSVDLLHVLNSRSTVHTGTFTYQDTRE